MTTAHCNHSAIARLFPDDRSMPLKARYIRSYAHRSASHLYRLNYNLLWSRIDPGPCSTGVVWTAMYCVRSSASINTHLRSSAGGQRRTASVGAWIQAMCRKVTDRRPASSIRNHNYENATVLRRTKIFSEYNENCQNCFEFVFIFDNLKWWVQCPHSK